MRESAHVSQHAPAFPVGSPYDPSSNRSLLALLQRARNLIEPAPNGGEAPSWPRYIGFVETVCDHFRRLAVNPAAASSALLFSLNVSVRQILFLLLNECRRARDVSSSSLGKLEEKAGGLIWFYGRAAYNAKVMDHQRAREASECLGCVGLSYLESGFHEPALTAARNITSLAERGAQKLKRVSLQELASLLLPLRWVKLLAGEMDQTMTLERLEETVQGVIKKLSALNDLKATLDELERQRWSAEDLVDGSLLPQEALEVRQKRRQIQACLRSLAPKERAAFVLRDLEGLDTRTVARALRVSQVTVRRHASNARRKIRARLERQFPDLFEGNP